MPIAEQSAMREDDWSSLVTAVQEGECILMVGRDAVMGTFDGERLPLPVGLARFVKQKLGPEYEDLDPTDTSSVAQAAILKEDGNTLRGWVKAFNDGIEDESPVLADLAALPFRHVISTSPGLSVDVAFRAAKPGTNVDFYDRTGRAHANFPDPTVEAPLVYGLYGSLERPASLILSDSDRLDFLVSVIKGDPPLPAKLESTLREPKRSFLFLGFGLHDWQLRILMHVLAQDSRRRLKSFAIELEETGIDAGTKLFYESGHRISFYDMSVETFAAELRQRVGLEAATSAPAVGEVALSPDAPVVFLCHASEDKEYAERLADGLRRSGIGTWLDKEDLRGGDRWNALIRRTIEDEVAYVVVIQSASLKDKDVGFVNREIKIALERQELYRAPRRFLFPVIIDSSTSRLEDLEHIQSVDLSGVGGVEDLIRGIKRDLADGQG